MDLHEIDVHEERLLGFSVAVQILERGLFNVAVEERDTNHAFLAVHDGRIDVLTIDLEFLARRFTGVARQGTACHLLEHRAEFRIHIREPSWIRIGIGIEMV
ncbi:hypothetical protein D3C86_910290 [compost metagenome]